MGKNNEEDRRESIMRIHIKEVEQEEWVEMSSEGLLWWWWIVLTSTIVILWCFVSARKMVAG